MIPGRYGVARIASRVAATQGPALELSQAGHSRLGAMDPVAGIGSPAVDDGDTVSLAYTVTNDPGTRAEPWIVLLSNPVASEPAPLRSTAPAVTPPSAFALHIGRPNPFRNEVAIGFDLPVAAPIRIEIHDLQGRLVSVIANAAYPAGRHEVRWDRRGRTGSLAAPGVYLYSMTAGEFRAWRRMIALP